MHIKLNNIERSGHLPHLLHDVIARLRLGAGSKAPISKAAAEHGNLEPARNCSTQPTPQRLRFPFTVLARERSFELISIWESNVGSRFISNLILSTSKMRPIIPPDEVKFSMSETVSIPAPFTLDSIGAKCFFSVSPIKITCDCRKS